MGALNITTILTFLIVITSDTTKDEADLFVSITLQIKESTPNKIKPLALNYKIAWNTTKYSMDGNSFAYDVCASMPEDCLDEGAGDNKINENIASDHASRCQLSEETVIRILKKCQRQIISRCLSESSHLVDASGDTGFERFSKYDALKGCFQKKSINQCRSSQWCEWMVQQQNASTDVISSLELLGFGNFLLDQCSEYKQASLLHSGNLNKDLLPSHAVEQVIVSTEVSQCKSFLKDAGTGIVQHGRDQKQSTNAPSSSVNQCSSEKCQGHSNVNEGSASLSENRPPSDNQGGGGDDGRRPPGNCKRIGGCANNTTLSDDITRMEEGTDGYNNGANELGFSDDNARLSSSSADEDYHEELAGQEQAPVTTVHALLHEEEIEEIVEHSSEGPIVPLYGNRQAELPGSSRFPPLSQTNKKMDDTDSAPDRLANLQVNEAGRDQELNSSVPNSVSSQLDPKPPFIDEEESAHAQVAHENSDRNAGSSLTTELGNATTQRLLALNIAHSSASLQGANSFALDENQSLPYHESLPDVLQLVSPGLLEENDSVEQDRQNLQRELLLHGPESSVSDQDSQSQSLCDNNTQLLQYSGQ